MSAKGESVAVLGGGVAGGAFALFLKSFAPEDEVVIYEASDKVGARILVSGNGRSNFYNSDYFDARKLADPIFQRARKVVVGTLGKEAFDALVKLTRCPFYFQGNLAYPYANKSQALFDALQDALNREGVKLVRERVEKLISADGKGVSFQTEGGEPLRFDRVALALGGNSLNYAPFDWSMLSCLGLKHVPYTPAICPLKVKEEGLSALDGNRVKGVMTLLDKGRKIYEEEGEILFKKDGLSGICVFNASVRIDPDRIGDYSILLDLSTHSGQTIGVDASDVDYCFPKAVSAYVKERAKKDGVSLREECSSLSFRVADLYPFKASQISKGGIAFEEFSPEDMTLRKHPNVVVLGEMLDIPLPCGGYNIGLCFIEAYKAAKALARKESPAWKRT